MNIDNPTVCVHLPPMIEAECTPLAFSETGYFSSLILDYLAEKPELKSLYHRFPSVNAFKEQIEEKSIFPDQNRKVLHEVLTDQYKDLEGEKVHENIRLLQQSNTFTITTGHQLNIFTGPLYFVYKILSVVNLVEKLKKEYPSQNFVPVYWMASEDHDFAEINHINMAGGRLSWPLEAKGATGRLSTTGMQQVVAQLEELLEPSDASEELLQVFKDAYCSEKSLAQATLQIVHKLFASYGLVVVDADHAALKHLAVDHFKADLFEHRAHKRCEQASAYLRENYTEQVHIREINLFYLKDDLRERIEKQEDKYVVLNTDIVFTHQQVLQELEEHPERFSPNVVLRPLYQEVILPNLSYTGGGGELAYWLQYKSLFEVSGIPFPILILRNSALLATAKQDEKAKKMGLQLVDLFGKLPDVKKKWVQQHAEVDTGLSAYERRIENIFNELEEVAHLTDKSMLGAVNAQRQKQLNGLQNLKKKLIRAEKRQHSDHMQRIEKLFYELFPNGSLQERHNNISIWYGRYGKQLITEIKNCFDPLDFRFSVITLSERG